MIASYCQVFFRKMLKKVDFHSFACYDSLMTTGQIIIKRRIELGWTQLELAEKIGYTSKTSISKIESDAVDLPQKKLKRFAEVLGIDIREFFPDVPSYEADSGILTIPFVSQLLSAGNGETYQSEEELSLQKINILADMAKGIPKASLIACRVRGDSMIDENINSGDIVIFSKGLISQEGIYVINFANELMVKRLSFDPLEKKVNIISGNKNYPMRTVDADCVSILGKVVGWIHNESF